MLEVPLSWISFWVVDHPMCGFFAWIGQVPELSVWMGSWECLKAVEVLDVGPL